jgi:predicted transcriptional regulator
VANDKDKELNRRIMLDLNSSKNDDVYNKMNNRDKAKYPKVIDYICDAIRSFQENQGNSNVDMIEIKTMVNVLIEEKLKGMNIKAEDDTKEEFKTSLEDNIMNEIDCEDD